MFDRYGWQKDAGINSNYSLASAMVWRKIELVLMRYGSRDILCDCLWTGRQASANVSTIHGTPASLLQYQGGTTIEFSVTLSAGVTYVKSIPRLGVSEVVPSNKSGPSDHARAERL